MICNTEFELSKQIKGARFCRAIWRIHWLLCCLSLDFVAFLCT
jgi:hypothetical protein